MKRLMICAPAAAVVLGGCFATQSDIRVLQGDLGLVRSEAAAADSAHRAELSRIEASLGTVDGSLRDMNTVMRRVTDSVMALNSRMTRFRSDMSTSMSSVEQQMLQVQELAGQSQRKLQELRTSMEERQQTQGPLPGPTPGPTEAPTAAGDGAPGPNQLFQAGREQLLQKSYETARTAFQDLVTKYPKHELVPDAQFSIAETYSAESDADVASGATDAAQEKAQTADSIYALVAAKYPKSPRAATSLYKRGILAQKAGKGSDAQKLFRDVIKKYPRSDEASLAQPLLKTSK